MSSAKQRICAAIVIVTAIAVIVTLTLVLVLGKPKCSKKSLETDPFPHQCGRKDKSIIGSVVGGATVKPGEHPWQVRRCCCRRRRCCCPFCFFSLSLVVVVWSSCTEPPDIIKSPFWQFVSLYRPFYVRLGAYSKSTPLLIVLSFDVLVFAEEIHLID